MDEIKRITFEDTLNYFRICVVGAKNVGKSTFINNFLSDEKFKPNKNEEKNISFSSINPTNSLQLYSKKMIFKKDSISESDNKYITINLMIDDTPGYVDNTKKNNLILSSNKDDINNKNSLVKSSLSLTKGIILMYSIDSKESYDIVLELLLMLKRFKNFKQKYIALIGNKSDIKETDRQVSYEKALKLSQKNNFIFYEISSINDLNCGKKIFSELLSRVFSNQLKLDVVQIDKLSESSKYNKNNSVIIDMFDKKENLLNDSKDKNLNLLNTADNTTKSENKNNTLVNMKLLNVNDFNNINEDTKNDKLKNDEKISFNINLNSQNSIGKNRYESPKNNNKMISSNKDNDKINYVIEIKYEQHDRTNSAINMRERKRSGNHVYFERKVKNSQEL